MKKLRLSSAVRPLAEYVDDFRGETLILTEHGRAVAAVIPLRNIDPEALTLSQHPEFLALIERSRADFAAGRTVSLADMKRRVLPKRATKKRVKRVSQGRTRVPRRSALGS